MNARIKICAALFFSTLLWNCGGNSSKSTQTEEKKPTIVHVPTPDFDSQGAYDKVQKQVDFGYRVPNTPAHKACGDWIVEQMKANGLEVIEQPFDAFSFRGEKLNGRNIIASYNPEAKKRVLLAAHWDTRAVADQDDEQKDKPIPGANDAGSGVAILIQLAQTINQAAEKPSLGIDYIFFDVEDGGAPDSYTGNPMNEYSGYLMGSDYWSQNLHKANYSVYYGILLDMVGASGATFRKEDTSMKVAPSVVNKVWETASSKGFGTYFLDQSVGGLLDDHIPVIKNAKIPMIDIIDLKNSGSQMFFDHWHTHEDNMEAIDKNTLEAVGETLLQVLYDENGLMQ
ncbi:M28 family peptidase [Marinilongibacter aquaticus]|uniref:M28 family peptidase n=1 Tax=Marinilongibacter aquaticus TaxID=2975157 RepID=UPI0021BD7E1A|nr:M28 family peptidase [Marinilongibacter aquaticus]UBM57925.1 M28 family peptidase [Marinilongibacter aquaticus]